jgi:hypothetical protein
MSSTKNRRDGIHTDHLVSGKDKRAERRTEVLLRRAHIVREDEWDEFDLPLQEQRFKRNQKLD